jgi:hypothetical protein
VTQREKVLGMLRSAGKAGVRSDAFYAAFLPRAGARVHELRQEGYTITSEREGQFVRYRLSTDSGKELGHQIERSLKREDAYWREQGGHPSPPQPSLLPPERQTPSAYDPWGEAAR